ncbi:MAG: DNRLRE domain-containing protein [Ruminiclostridium sp.]|nr:DNRLRE domain-containing protein [Ruminiclostridium sp.]
MVSSKKRGFLARFVTWMCMAGIISTMMVIVPAPKNVYADAAQQNTNLIKNAGFEQDGLSAWTTGGTVQGVIATDDFNTGAKSVKMTSASAFTSTLENSATGCAAGPYNARVTVKASGTWTSAKFQVYEGTTLKSETSISSGSTWDKYTINNVSVSAGAVIKVKVSVDAAAGAVFYIDDFWLEEVLTDEKFFGVWNGSSWTTVGKFDYSYNNNALSAVETAVKAGNYTNAKSELLTYYRNRTSPTVTPLDDSFRDTNWADLSCDNILKISKGEYYLTTFSVDNTYAWKNINVTDGVKTALGGPKLVNFIIMARKKESSAAGITSKEGGANKPVLDVTIGGSVYSVTGTDLKDTTIRGGSYIDTNFGTETTLGVKDTGNPADDYARKAYITFDMSGLPAGTPTLATLKLYAANTSATGNKDLMVFRSENTGWVESGAGSLTWNNAKQTTFSWQGLAAGPTWETAQRSDLPTLPAGSDSEYGPQITRFPFAWAMAWEYNKTGTETYASNLIRLMTDFINDTDNAGSKNGPGYNRGLDSGSRLRAWIRAYPYIKSSTSLDAESNTKILKHLWRVGNWLGDSNNEYPNTNSDWDSASFHSTNNWGVAEALGLYMDAVYFPEFSVSGNWETLAKSRLDVMALTLNYIDGSYKESTVHYAQAIAFWYWAAKDMGDRNGKTFSQTFDKVLERVSRYLMDSLLPNGYDPMFGDSFYLNYQQLIKNIGTLLDNNELIWYGSDGTSGTEPALKSTVYPVGQFANMKTGPQDSDYYLHIDTNVGNHGHFDLLYFIAYAYGRTLIADRGVYSYEEGNTTGEWLRWNNQSHNTIYVNDTKSWMNVQRNLDSFTTNDYFDFYEGDAATYDGLTQFRSALFIKPSKTVYNSKNDFSSTQGNKNWYYQRTDGTNYYDLTWNSSASRWDYNTWSPVMTSDNQSTQDGWDAVRKWVAPSSGVVNIKGTIASLGSYSSSDGFNVKITKNGSNIWPTSGWQYIAGTDTTGYSYDMTLWVDQGDAIGFVANKYSTKDWDNVKFDADITQYSGSGYWIVSDYENATAVQRKIEQDWHFKDTANISIDTNTKKTSTDFDSGPNIQVVPADPNDLSAVLADGYYSEQYLALSNAKYTQYIKNNVTGSTTFDTVLYPTGEGESRNVAVTRLTTTPSVASTVATALKVDLNSGASGNVGYYYLSHQGGSETVRDFDEYNFGGKLAYIEKDSSGNLVSALVKGGKTLKKSGTNIINSAMDIEQIGVKWSGTTLEIYGEGLIPDTGTSTAIAVYAPSATSVKLNGAAVSSTKSGNYVYAARQTKFKANPQKDFTSTQGANNWYYQKTDGSAYSNLTWNSTSNRWDDSTYNPVITSTIQSTQNSWDSARKWVAPAAGILNIKGSVASSQSYSQSDGFNVKILKNSSNVWPASGWQYIAGTDTTGKSINETISVNQGDVIYLIANKYSTPDWDNVVFKVDMTLYPGATLFSDNFEDQNSTGWTALTPSRWTVGTDGGSYSYYINTTSYNPQSGNRPGEYSLIDNSDYTTFTINLNEKVGDSVSTNSTADSAVIFNYQDASNYYYLVLNNDKTKVQLFKVVSGTAGLVADSDGTTDWVADNNYHNISIERDGDTGFIGVWYDSGYVISVYDKTFNGGKAGVGSYDDSAYFDNISVIKVK